MKIFQRDFLSHAFRLRCCSLCIGGGGGGVKRQAFNVIGLRYLKIKGI